MIDDITAQWSKELSSYSLTSCLGRSYLITLLPYYPGFIPALGIDPLSLPLAAAILANGAIPAAQTNPKYLVTFQKNITDSKYDISSKIVF